MRVERNQGAQTEQGPVAGARPLRGARRVGEQRAEPGQRPGGGAAEQRVHAQLLRIVGGVGAVDVELSPVLLGDAEDHGLEGLEQFVLPV